MHISIHSLIHSTSIEAPAICQVPSKQSPCSRGAYTLVEEVDDAQSIQMCQLMCFAKNEAEK